MLADDEDVATEEGTPPQPEPEVEQPAATVGKLLNLERAKDFVSQWGSDGCTAYNSYDELLTAKAEAEAKVQEQAAKADPPEMLATAGGPEPEPEPEPAPEPYSVRMYIRIVVHVDPATGDTYYVNEVAQESYWEEPAGATLHSFESHEEEQLAIPVNRMIGAHITATVVFPVDIADIAENTPERTRFESVFEAAMAESLGVCVSADKVFVDAITGADRPTPAADDTTHILRQTKSIDVKFHVETEASVGSYIATEMAQCVVDEFHMLVESIGVRPSTISKPVVTEPEAFIACTTAQQRQALRGDANPACQAAFDGDTQLLATLVKADPANASAAGWVATGEGVQGIYTPGFDKFCLKPGGLLGKGESAVPLQYAAFQGQAEAVRLLLELGDGRVDAGDQGGCRWSANIIAACAGSGEVRALLPHSR
jgi:hypothetical protein